MKMKDDALDRIADALEKKYGVQPYVDVSGVIAGHVKRIANALAEGLGVTTKTLSNGTELNELIRIAEVLETYFEVTRLIQVGNTTDEPLDRIAHVLEVSYETGRVKYSALTRIAVALEMNYLVRPKVDMFGNVFDAVHRIADVMESDAFQDTYSPPIELYVDFGDSNYEPGDHLDFTNASISVLRANGKITPVDNSDVTFDPDTTYAVPNIGLQVITAEYEEAEPEK